jgi:hypothetical protein
MAQQLTLQKHSRLEQFAAAAAAMTLAGMTDAPFGTALAIGIASDDCVAADASGTSCAGTCCPPLQYTTCECTRMTTWGSFECLALKQTYHSTKYFLAESSMGHDGGYEHTCYGDTPHWLCPPDLHLLHHVINIAFLISLVCTPHHPTADAFL